MHRDINRIAELEAELEETYRSVTELTNELGVAKERLERLSLYDDLTGLANRPLYQDRFEHARSLADREEQSLLILVLDLDRFKNINDTFGHEAGDLVLTTIAKRLKQRLRDSDTIARMGGDEFAFLIKWKDTMTDPSRIAKEIAEIVQQPIEIENNSVDVGASIGIASYPEDGAELSYLLRLADKAMYQAKQNGNDYKIYIGGQFSESDEGPQIFMTELRNGLERNELEFFYQPKIDMRSLKLCGVEALVRWRHPEKGMIMPDDFVPLTERSALITPFTRTTVSLAIEQLVRWQESGLSHTIAVNLSSRSLHDIDLANKILEQLSDWQELSEYLVFEVTETALMIDPELSVRTLTRLASLGATISIDDFGTGYSSLSYLSNLPVQELKIDRSFVSKMHSHKDNEEIVRSIIDLAHKLGMSVVAEGVESHNDWAKLASFDCEYMQGYYISRPLPVDKFWEWQQQWSQQHGARRDETIAVAGTVRI